MNGDSTNYWLEMLGFGIAGFDPTIPLIALAFVLVGVRTRVIVTFLATAIIGTYALAVALSLTIGQLTAIPRGLDHLRHGPIRAELEIVTAISALIWLGIRIARGPDDSEPEPPNATERGAALLAIAIVLAWVADPGFLGGVIVAGHSDDWVDVLLAQVLWVVAAQWPLVFVIGAMLIGSPQRIAESFNTWWILTAPHRFHALNIAAASILILIAIDAGHYILEHHYLVFNAKPHHHPHPA
ncbi:MAG: hypothetical protein ACTHOG_04225 [Marmoricola sp.]